MKHGDLPDCGHDYATDESTARAYCPHCREVMPLAKDQGRIVRLTSKTMKLLYGQGGRGAPINGRIVGQAGPFPIVQWSNGETGGISAAGIETDKRVSTRNASPNRSGGSEGDIKIQYGVVKNKREGYGWLPAVWENGRQRGDTYAAHGWDKDEALARAKFQAEEVAARFVGDWNVTVVRKK